MGKTITTITIDLDARLTKLEQGLKGATDATNKASREMRAQMTEARGAIALLGEEIGIHLPRHLRNFVAELPGVSKLMSSAFTGVAVLGLGKMFADGAMKAYELGKQGAEAAKKLRESFAGIHAEAEKSNDELRVTNDRLAMEIAKLEGKHGNGLKLALDEARVAADKLTESAGKAAKEMQKVLREGSVGWWNGVFSGRAPTQDVEDLVQQQLSPYLKHLDENREAVRAATTEEEKKTAQTYMHKQAAEDLASALKTVNAQLGMYQAANTAGQRAGNQEANVEILRTARTHINDELERLALEQENAGLSGQKATLDKSKAAKDQRVKQWTDELNETRMVREVTVAEELQFWQQRIEQLTKGSDAYHEVAAKVATLVQQMARQWNEIQKREGKDAANWIENLNKHFGGEIAAQINKTAKAQQEYADAEMKAALAQAKENAEMENGYTGWLETIGAISAAEGIQRRMNAATAEFVEEQAILGDAITSAESWALINPEAIKELERLRAELEKLRKENALTIGELKGAKELQGWTGAFAPLLRSAQNTAAELKQIFAGAVDGINTELSRLMTGQKTNFKSLFQGIAADIGKIGLQKLEGTILGKLGLGGGKKPTGAQSDPIFTRSADIASGAAGDATKKPMDAITGHLQGIFEKLKGMFGKIGEIVSSIAQSIAGFLSKIFGGMFGGFRAGGGDLDAGKFYVAGEAGPEIIGGVNGRAYNARTTAQMLSGGGAHYFIDARGTNAAEVEARVQRSLVAVHGSAVKTSISGYEELARRRVLAPA